MVDIQQLTTILSSGVIITVCFVAINALKADISSLRDEMRTGFSALHQLLDEMLALSRPELRSTASATKKDSDKL